MHKRRFLFISSLLTLLIFLSASVTVQANIFKDFIEGVKKVVEPNKPKGELKIDSNISFAKDGDLNKNGEFDAGDFVTFSFKIENTSDQEYPFSTLQTRVPSDSINSIRNIIGATGVTRGENVVEFPNIYLNKNQTLNISFDATLTYIDQAKNIEVATEFYDDKRKKLKETPKRILNIKATPDSLKGKGMGSAKKIDANTKDSNDKKELKQEVASSSAKVIEEIVEKAASEVKESTTPAENLERESESSEN